MSTRYSNSLWVISSLFFKDVRSPRASCFYTFRDKLREAQVPLCIVELAAHGESFLLQEDDADIVGRYHGEVGIWQKNTLLNKAITLLPEHCTEVAVLDADIVFMEEDWPARIKDMLKKVLGGQVFSRYKHLGAHEDIPTKKELQTERMRSLWKQNEYEHGFSFGYLSVMYPHLYRFSEKQGHPGFGWAFRRSLLDTHGLFDETPVGGADEIFSRSLYWPPKRGQKVSYIPDYIWRRGGKWMLNIQEEFSDVRACCNLTIVHLYHGDVGSRNYFVRNLGAFWKKFSFEKDIHRDENGFFKFAEAEGSFARSIDKAMASSDSDQTEFSRVQLRFRKIVTLVQGYYFKKESIFFQEILAAPLYRFLYRNRSPGMKNSSWYLVNQEVTCSILWDILKKDLLLAGTKVNDGREQRIPEDAIRCSFYSGRCSDVRRYLGTLRYQTNVYEYICLQSSKPFSKEDLAILESERFSYETFRFRTLRSYFVMAARRPDHDQSSFDWEESPAVLVSKIKQ